MMNHQYNQYPPAYTEQAHSDFDTSQQSSSSIPTSATDAMDTDEPAFANGSANGELEISPKRQLDEPPAAPVHTQVTGNEDMQVEKNPSAETGLEDGRSDQNTIEKSTTGEEENHTEE